MTHERSDTQYGQPKRDGKDEQPYGFTGKSGNLTDFSRLAGNRQVIHQYLERKRELKKGEVEAML